MLKDFLGGLILQTVSPMQHGWAEELQNKNRQLLSEIKKKKKGKGISAAKKKYRSHLYHKKKSNSNNIRVGALCSHAFHPALY